MLMLRAAIGAHAAVPVVAAENFYGDIARQIGGPEVSVASVLSNPNQDPHLFEASPSVARTILGARIAIMDGVGYDPWMTKLLGAARGKDRTTIVVGDLAGKKQGDNPHISHEAKGVSLRLQSVLFLAVVALAIAGCAQIVGVLLVFTLMVGPAAAAQRLTSRIGAGVLLSAALALVEAWSGIMLAFYTDWPASFWIAALSAAVYAPAALARWWPSSDSNRDALSGERF